MSLTCRAVNQTSGCCLELPSARCCSELLRGGIVAHSRVACCYMVRLVQPAAPESQLQGVRPNEEHVKALGAIGFDEATARQCLSVAFNDLELAAQYCMEGIPAARLRRA